MATADWSTTTSPPNASMWIKDIGFYVHFCSVAIIIPVGLVCNAFSIGVFMAASKFRRTSTGQLLIALSAVDWLVLIGDGLRWLTKADSREVYITGLKFYDTSEFACKFINIWRYRCHTRIYLFNALFVRKKMVTDNHFMVRSPCYRRTRQKCQFYRSVGGLSKALSL